MEQTKVKKTDEKFGEPLQEFSSESRAHLQPMSAPKRKNSDKQKEKKDKETDRKKTKRALANANICLGRTRSSEKI